MIILDTNVVSAMMQREADPAVRAWLNGVAPESVWITSITVFEIEFGIALLAKGRRRSGLEDAFAASLAEDFGGRILGFDDEAARQAAALASRGRRAGRPVDFRDLEIAGIAAARKAELATRNTKHFDGLGLKLVDPWKA